MLVQVRLLSHQNSAGQTLALCCACVAVGVEWCVWGDDEQDCVSERVEKVKKKKKTKQKERV